MHHAAATAVSVMAGSAPHSTGVNGPGFAVPPLSCDCHMHLFDNALPYAGDNVLKHPDASIDDYRRLQGRLGLQRNVLVQPSSYGRDHRAMLEGLALLGDKARGVAVVDTNVEVSELKDLDDHGVVGVRFNLVQKGAADESMLEAVAADIAPFGWHLQVHLHAAQLLRLSSRLAALSVPVVIDHYARVNTEPALSAQVLATLEHLLATGKVWLKLSAPYIALPGGSCCNELDGMVECISSRFADRLVWGSDWPHVTEPTKPDDAVLLNLLDRWFPSAQAKAQILVENPTRLYRF